MSDPTPIKSTPISPIKRSSVTTTKEKKRIPWPLLLIPVVLLVAYAVFNYVPTVIPDVARTITPSAQSDSEEAPPVAESDLPFRDIELERSKEQAKEILKEFGKLQDRIETEQLGLAAEQGAYDQIIDEANAADGAFSRREFGLAIEGYESALRRLTAYAESNDERFESQFQSGMEALDARELDKATSHLEAAQAIKPHASMVKHALKRLALLPQVNQLIRESQRAQFRGDKQQAKDLLREVQQLDPETKGIQARILEINRSISQDEFNRVISEALASLGRGDLSTARSRFNRANLMQPGSEVVESGLQRVQQAETGNEVNLLQEKAKQFEAAEDFTQALVSYEDLLLINPNLQFAREGSERASQVLRLLRTVNRFLDDPTVLSSAEEFERANTAARESQNFLHLSSELSDGAQRLEQTLIRAMKPLPVILLSDSAMEVRLSTIGDLGLFDRKEVSLRPGRYLLTGSGDGCRDVRRTIVVSEGMEPVAIRCDEPI